MKKQLIVAAVAAAVAAPVLAQNVTISGNLSTAIGYVDDGSVTSTQMLNNALAQSQITVGGSEDLGGGLKATFALESALGADDGSAGTTRVLTAAGTTSSTTILFNRQANVGIEGGFGRIVVGRQQTAVNAYKDVNAGVKAFDNPLSAAVGRPANSVGYHTPTFNGISAQVVYSVGVEFEGTATATKSNNKAIVLGGQYAQGPLTVRLARGQLDKRAVDAANVAPAAAGDRDDTDTFIGAEYDLGVVKVGLAQHALEQKTISTGAKAKFTANMLTAVAPLGSGFSAHLAYHMIDKKASQEDATMIGIAVKKDLSKRTAVFAAYRNGENDTTAGTGTYYGAAAGKTSNLYGIGVNHSF